MILPSPTNRFKYELSHKDFDSIIIPEPIGWNSDEKEYARNKKHHGIIAKFSNNLKFYKEASDFILLVDGIYGVNADLTLTKYERHPITNRWELIYSGNFDLTTLKEEKGLVSVKFNSGSFDKVRKSRFSKKVEIDRTTDLEGNQIPELVTKEMALDGRKIFLKTSYEVKPSDNNLRIHLYSTGGKRRTSEGIPLQLINKSHEEAQSVSVNSEQGEDWDNGVELVTGTAGALFFANSEPHTRTIRVEFVLRFLFDLLNNDEVYWSDCQIVMTKYKGGSDYLYKERTVLFSLDSEDEQRNFDNQYATINYDQFIEILEGESLSLQFISSTQINGGNSGHLDIMLRNITCPLTIEEESYAEPSRSKVILAHELGERLTRIITGKENAFYSEFFGRTDIAGYNYQTDGPGAYTGYSHGMWIRQFDKTDTLFKSFTTSWKDFNEATDSVLNMGLGIEVVGKRERIRYEPEDFFYQNHVTIKLGKTINGKFEYLQPNNIKRTKAKEFLYTGLEFGCLKGGEYEESSGLDEYNAKATFSTPIKIGKNIYKKTCKYRPDSYGGEFTRRKSKFTHSTEDYRTDKEIFINDLKKGNTSILLQRKWQDDFEEEPTGVFSPETATNLRYSPVNCLLRHGWIISASGLKYQSKFIRYNSSAANSRLTTKLRSDLYPTLGGVSRSENGNIKVSDLQRARFVPEWIEFEYKVDFFINQAIQGSTTVLGKTIPNFYGLVQFINEKGDLEKGFLYSVKPNGKGKWKILKANR
ncbi:MAG: hypothetical protein HRT69_18025 [Flavobacteriaceae bacterium]|nr:hypothetical protein [Flavobacteriaceae bacterium]